MAHSANIKDQSSANKRQFDLSCLIENCEKSK